MPEKQVRRGGRLSKERAARKRRATQRHKVDVARASAEAAIETPAPEAGAAEDAVRPAPVLRGKQKRYLRGLAHHLEAVVSVGKEGLTGPVVGAVDRALGDHELVKVRVLESAPLGRTESGDALAITLRACCVGEIGRIVMLYRPHPKTPRIVLPRS